MSIKVVHFIFITLSTLLAFGFGAWCVSAYLRDRNDLYIGMGVTSVLAGVGLIVYGIRFRQKIKRLHL